MKQELLAGVASRTEYLYIRDALSGAPKTGLVFNTSGLAASYIRSLGSRVAITLATQTVNGAWSSGGFAECDGSNLPGIYRFDIPDAAFAAGANKAIVQVIGTNLLASPLEYQLVAFNPDDAVRMGLTALPNAAAEASGGLPTLSAAQASNGTIQANVHRWLTGTPNALSSGRVDVIVGAVTSGVIAAASFAAGALDAVWSTATRLLTAGTNIVLAKGVGVTGFNDIAAGAAMTLTAGERTAIANEVEAQIIDDADAEKVLAAITDKIAAVNPSLSGLTLAAIAVQVRTELAVELARIDATISSRLAAAGYTAPLDAAAVRAAMGLGSANLDTQLDALPTNAELATALSAADDAVLAAIAALNNLSSAQVIAAVPTAIQNADALLKRDFAAVTGEATRSLLNAQRFIRNKFVITAGVLTVYKEDDTTAAWTGAVTKTAGDPVTAIDPV